MGSLAVFPKGDSMNGIFDALKKIDDTYESQYSIEATFVYADKTRVYSYQSSTADRHFATANGKLKINFKTPFVLTDYSFANSGTPQQSHSHPRSWNIHGTSVNGNTVLIDQRTNYTACNDSIECHNSVVKTFHAKHPRKVNDITITQTTSSSSSTYIVLRAIEIFGMFCNNSHACYALLRPTICRERESITSLLMTMIMLMIK